MTARALAAFGALLGDAARARMLVALFDHVELRASDLARHAAVSPQTTSFHLRKLCDAGFLTVSKRGRSRVYALAGPPVAGALEAVMALVPDGANDGEPRSIELARTCYDHLAGRLGVVLAEALVRERWLEVTGKEYAVTASGGAAFAELGIDVVTLRRLRRQLARRCLDWTERRYHIAGSLGAALHDVMRARKWIVALRGSRVVHVSPDGHAALRRVFKVQGL